MAKYETISVKVPSELKEEVKRHGIKTRDVVRKALEHEVKKRLEELDRELEKMKPVLYKIKMEDVVAGIREDRES